ncbi:MAG: hypothetical protein Q9170_006296 [Blastenia crenularia]
MSFFKLPPTPNWRTHPLAQKLLNPLPKPETMEQETVTPIPAPQAMNAVYYPNWKVYGQTPPSTLDLEHITHVYYAFIFDEAADTKLEIDGTQGGLNAIKNLKQRKPSLKILLSVGGGGPGSDPFAAMAHSPTAREHFASSAKQILDKYGFDGLDIDWEHPDDPGKGADYVSLMATLRKHLPARKYTITTALPAGTWALQYIDLGKAASNLDYINIMAYDFAGPWTKTSGYQAQLHAPPKSPADMQTSGQSCVQYMRSKGVPANKMCLGIPVYGRSFLGVSHVNQNFKASGGEEGTFEYKRLPRPGTQEKVDHQAGAAYCVGGDGGFVSYDNPDTVTMKAQFVKQQKLAGLFYWTGPGDQTGPRSLVAAGYKALHKT